MRPADRRAQRHLDFDTIIPEGWLTIARRFNAGTASKNRPSPEGTAEKQEALTSDTDARDPIHAGERTASSARSLLSCGAQNLNRPFHGVAKQVGSWIASNKAPAERHVYSQPACQKFGLPLLPFWRRGLGRGGRLLASVSSQVHKLNALAGRLFDIGLGFANEFLDVLVVVESANRNMHLVQRREYKMDKT